jgi:hypothetical protein
MDTMTPERLQEIQEWVTHESFQRGALLEPEGMIIGECLAEIDRLTRELEAHKTLEESWRVRGRKLEAENAQLRRDIDRLRTGLSESLQLQRHYAVLLNTWDGGQRTTVDSVEKWLERVDAIRKEPQP